MLTLYSMTRYLLLITILVANVLPQGGWVLCIESDGHVAFEAGNVLGRCTDGDTIPARSESLASDVSHCGDCQDLVIDAYETRQASSSEGVDVPVQYGRESYLTIIPAFLPVERLVEANRHPTPAVHLLNVSFLL
jgi:hypothetical protein